MLAGLWPRDHQLCLLGKPQQRRFGTAAGQLAKIPDMILDGLFGNVEFLRNGRSADEIRQGVQNIQLPFRQLGQDRFPNGDGGLFLRIPAMVRSMTSSSSISL